LAKLAYDKKFVESLVHLTPIVSYDKKFESIFDDIVNKLLKVI